MKAVLRTSQSQAIEYVLSHNFNNNTTKCEVVCIKIKQKLDCNFNSDSIIDHIDGANNPVLLTVKATNCCLFIYKNLLGEKKFKHVIRLDEIDKVIKSCIYLVEEGKELTESELTSTQNKLQCLRNLDQTIVYGLLPEPLKLLIHNKTAIFQCVTIKIKNIIQKNEGLLKNFSVDDLHQIIFKKNFKIGEKIAPNDTNIKRKFFREENIDSTENVAKFIKEQKKCILCYCPGDGISFQMAEIALFLKKSNPLYYVMQTSLNDNCDIFDNIKENFEELEVLLKFKNDRNAFETKLLEFSFHLGQVIVFLDNYSIICPKYDEKVKMLLNKLEKRKILFCVSTYPFHVVDLYYELNVLAFKIINLSNEEIFTFICEQMKGYSKEQCNKLYKFLEDNSMLCGNPLIIKIITKLYIRNANSFKSDSLNLKNICESIIDELNISRVQLPEDNMIEFRMKLTENENYIAFALYSFKSVLGHDLLKRIPIIKQFDLQLIDKIFLNMFQRKKIVSFFHSEEEIMPPNEFLTTFLANFYVEKFLRDNISVETGKFLEISAEKVFYKILINQSEFEFLLKLLKPLISSIRLSN